MFANLNAAVHLDIRQADISEIEADISGAYHSIRNNDLIFHFNNNGRVLEAVCYNWMRGYAICRFFLKALSVIFQVEQGELRHIRKPKTKKAVDIKTM